MKKFPDLSGLTKEERKQRAQQRWQERRAAGIPIGGPDERKGKKKRQSMKAATEEIMMNNHCLDCGNPFTPATTLRCFPDPGAMSVCIECGALLMFDETQRPRRPTPSEWVQIEQGSQWPDIVRMQASIRARQRSPEEEES